MKWRERFIQFRYFFLFSHLPTFPLSQPRYQFSFVWNEVTGDYILILLSEPFCNFLFSSCLLTWSKYTRSSPSRLSLVHLNNIGNRPEDHKYLLLSIIDMICVERPENLECMTESRLKWVSVTNPKNILIQCCGTSVFNLQKQNDIYLWRLNFVINFTKKNSQKMLTKAICSIHYYFITLIICLISIFRTSFVCIDSANLD